jgi:hypothetical protein
MAEAPSGAPNISSAPGFIAASIAPMISDPETTAKLNPKTQNARPPEWTVA